MPSGGVGYQSTSSLPRRLEQSAPAGGTGVGASAGVGVGVGAGVGPGVGVRLNSGNRPGTSG